MGVACTWCPDETCRQKISAQLKIKCWLATVCIGWRKHQSKSAVSLSLCQVPTDRRKGWSVWVVVWMKTVFSRLHTWRLGPGGAVWEGLSGTALVEEVRTALGVVFASESFQMLPVLSLYLTLAAEKACLLPCLPGPRDSYSSATTNQN